MSGIFYKIAHRGSIYFQENASSNFVREPTDVFNMKRGYCRFGDLPEDNLSINHFDGSVEKGLSVYECFIDGDNVIPILPPQRDKESYLWVGSQYISMRRPVYIVDGTPLHQKGSDGEVLLSDPTVIRKACFPIYNDYKEAIG